MVELIIRKFGIKYTHWSPSKGHFVQSTPLYRTLYEITLKPSVALTDIRGAMCQRLASNITIWNDAPFE